MPNLAQSLRGFGRRKPGPWARPRFDSALVGCWLANEGGGATLRDISGKSNNGTLSGTTKPTWARGQFGGSALSFDGNTSYVSLPASNVILASATAATLAAWILPTDSGSDHRILSFINAGSTRFAIVIGRAASKISAFFRDGANALIQLDSSINIPAGWLHVAATVVGTTGALYLNGAKVGSSASVNIGNTLGFAADAAIIGAGPGGVGTPFAGSLGSAKVHTRALPADEIYQNYTEPFRFLEQAAPMRAFFGPAGAVAVVRCPVLFSPEVFRAEATPRHGAYVLVGRPRVATPAKTAASIGLEVFREPTPRHGAAVVRNPLPRPTQLPTTPSLGVRQYRTEATPRHGALVAKNAMPRPTQTITVCLAGVHQYRVEATPRHGAAVARNSPPRPPQTITVGLAGGKVFRVEATPRHGAAVILPRPARGSQTITVSLAGVHVTRRDTRRPGSALRTRRPLGGQAVALTPIYVFRVGWTSSAVVPASWRKGVAVNATIQVFKGVDATILASALIPPQAIAGWTIQLTVRSRPGGAVLFTLGPANITDPVNGVFSFTCPAAQTITTGVGDFYYDVARTDPGASDRLAYGTFSVLQEAYV